MILNKRKNNDEKEGGKWKEYDNEIKPLFQRTIAKTEKMLKIYPK